MSSASPSVVVFGSLHYDIMVHGPARPRKGETVTGDHWHPKCGGKGGNQAVSAAKTGIPTSMIGAVADDDFGHALTDNLARSKVDHRFVKKVTGVGSGMSVAIFDSEGDYGAVIVSGSNLMLGQVDVDAASKAFVDGALLVLQNEVPDHANVSAAKAMKVAGGTVVLNAAPARPLSADLQQLVDVLVVNAIEAEQLAELPVVDTLEGAANAAKLLAAKFPVVVVTAGGDGVACATREGDAFSIEAIKVELVSTHGAGDEFTGVLASELARGSGIRAAIEAANHAAAVLVSTPRAN
ncbi:ribokinase [Rhizobium anhuiense]|uniref:Ribokinase n=1 Tax=Rhizobium anhuiense TaxID=1184720 RepID=A0A3S0QIK3_9HYPH|nr:MULTISPECIES: ribokinase [Rhizobium]MBB3741982.1 ribokinase [Rhizobium sp. BK591]MBB4111822.1 ribokinase [Rhizobium sp. BK226]MBB4218785.1 ribokinase [Rhizobium sp. BK212]PDS34296.1 ribokinase [Rhizobium anhuiense]PDS41404.1 ribokinase [Rhizobium anhuiense]